MKNCKCNGCQSTETIPEFNKAVAEPKVEPYPFTIPNISSPLKQPEVGYNYGWVCPKCGAVLSPYTSCCPYCAPMINPTVIYSNTTPTSKPIPVVYEPTCTCSNCHDGKQK